MKLLKVHIRPECDDFYELCYIRVSANGIYAWRDLPILFNHSIRYYIPEELGL